MGSLYSGNVNTLEHAHCLGSVSTTMAPGLVITSKPEGGSLRGNLTVSTIGLRERQAPLPKPICRLWLAFRCTVSLRREDRDVTEEAEHLSAADRTFFDVAVMVVIVAFPASAVRTPVAEIGCIHVLSSP